MKTKIKVKGMHCKSCTDKIESGISSMDGVSEVKADLMDNSVSVKFDPQKTSQSKIRNELETLGYSAGGGTSLAQGIAYGLMPHVGCIAFIAGSVLGVTVLMEFFKPLLMNRYFFHIMVAMSLGFATLSSALYLRKNGLLSTAGAKRKWGYLSTMYGSTVGINALLFLLVFPLLANVTSVTGAVVASGQDSLRLAVDIPCSGHAPLITDELKKLGGVTSVQFSLPNVFDVRYDGSKTTKEQMLSLDVFKEYPATVLDSTAQAAAPAQQKAAGTCGSGSCGSSCGNRAS